MNEESTKKSPVGMILYAIFFAIFIFIMSSIIFNSCRMSDHNIADDIIFDDMTKRVYEDSKDDFTVLMYDVEKRFEAVEANQLLQLKYFYYIPDAKQMQLTIKYNTSYAAAPTKQAIPFEILLKDHEGNNNSNYFYEAAEKDGYGYIRICWNNIHFDENSEYTLYINQEVDGKVKERGRFLMQKPSTAYKKMRITKKNAPYIYN